MFTLLGALIGGLSVSWAQRRERQAAARGVGRALALEMLNNCHSIAGFQMALANNPGLVLGPNIFPKVARSVFDQHLPSLAQLLKFDDLRRVALPYTAGYGPFLMLEAVIVAKPQSLKAEGLKIVKDTAEMFLDGLDVLENLVLTKQGREKFENEGIV